MIASVSAAHRVLNERKNPREPRYHSSHWLVVHLLAILKALIPTLVLDCLFDYRTCAVRERPRAHGALL